MHASQLEQSLALLPLPEQAAYLARMRWIATARPAQLTPTGDWRVWLILAGKGWGKRLCVDTPIPIPAGWSTMGELVAGDEIFDETGQICRVLEAHEISMEKNAYRVAFSDGSTIDACGEHLWLTETKATRKARGRGRRIESAKIITTTGILKTLKANGCELNHSIPCADALDLPCADLPIDPYLFGYWLGDGSSRTFEITCSDEYLGNLKREIRRAGYFCRRSRRKKGAKCGTYSISNGAREKFGPDGVMCANGSLHSTLKLLGVWNNKHIPSVYLRSSIKQRTELLAGLLDSDGFCDAVSGNVELTTKHKVLAEPVLELACSLGLKATITHGLAKLNGRVCGIKYRVNFTAYFRVFKLLRKASRQKQPRRQSLRQKKRYIANVTPIEPKLMRCITVDSPSNLYLCGKAMIPTHNTKTGVEDAAWYGLDNPESRVALVGPTAADCRDTIVEGASGLLTALPAEVISTWNRSLGEVVLANGTRYKAFSAEEPERLRGPQFHRAYCDEIAAWTRPETFDMLMFGLRLGNDPRTVITTTPKPTTLLRSLIKREGKDVLVTRGRTQDNSANLAPGFVSHLMDKYGGTRLGRQELDAEVLDDFPGALWQRSNIDATRVRGPPEMVRIVVAIDPAVSTSDGSDETGIIAAGKGIDGRWYVLADVSGRYSPDGWANRAIALYKELGADRVIGEVNNGGDMIESTLRNIDPNVAYKAVRASKGKAVRAEPVAAVYEQRRVSHVGAFPTLEDQLCIFTSDYDRTKMKYSPDRLDSLVWAMTELAIETSPGDNILEYWKQRDAEKMALATRPNR
jgi:phage terminase large subunit-like protein